MKPIIEAIDLQKIYSNDNLKVHALRGINLKINEGGFISIMGSSGSGKSTLMNILGCLDTQTSGNYFLDGIDVQNLNINEKALIRSKKIGFVFQSFNLLSRTTALENVELPLFYSNSKGNFRKKLAEDALSIVGLSDRKDHFPTQLSGGQQQRVAIARAMVNNPSIILADEPTGNLDSQTSMEIMKIFQNLNDKGKTIIMITHEKDIAEFGRKIINMKDGQIV
ncbi:MAG: ABC transporter ATP-binding protein [Thermodesulfobacteriota bacterium]